MSMPAYGLYQLIQNPTEEGFQGPEKFLRTLSEKLTVTGKDVELPYGFAGRIYAVLSDDFDDEGYDSIIVETRQQFYAFEVRYTGSGASKAYDWDDVTITEVEPSGSDDFCEIGETFDF